MHTNLFFHLAIYCPLLLAGIARAQPASTGNPIEISTPTELTTKWLDARDLSILFENAEDRLALAQLVVNECETNPGLSDVARLDGYRISGHICYRDGDLPLSTQAFHGAVASTDSPRWLAEAHRMLGQLALAVGDFALANQHFVQSWSNIEIDDPDMRFTASRSVLNQVCNTHLLTSNYDSLLNYSLIGIAKLDHPDLRIEQSQYLYWAYQANKHLGNSPAALEYLEDLLTQNPDFQSDDARGIILDLQLDVYILRDEGWDSPSPEFIQEVIEIVYDPNYLFTLSRVEILRKLGNLTESDGQDQAAIHLRSSLVQELDDALEASSELDPYIKGLLYTHSSKIKLDNASHLMLRGQIADASVILEELISSPAEQVDPNVSRAANHLQAQAIEILMTP